MSNNEFQAESNSVFKLQSYWEERFKQEDSYEWLVSWKTVAPQILPHIQPSDCILVVGCGNSSFSADLYDAGFHNITNIDFAASVIERMAELHRVSRPSMRWEVMDMTKLSYPEHSFDVVLDKAAMDALVVDEGDVWDPEQEVIDVVDRMCKSVGSVMKPNSTFLQISFAQPHFRTKYLMGYRADGISASAFSSHRGPAVRYGWELDYATIDSPAGCLNSFLYTMKRTTLS